MDKLDVDQVDRIELRVDAVHTVLLKSLGSAGYRWSVSVDDPAVLKVARVTAAPRNPGGQALGGAGRDEEFEVTGLAPGETTVHFSQARSFEPEKPPHATWDLQVRVV